MVLLGLRLQALCVRWEGVEERQNIYTELAVMGRVGRSGERGRGESGPRPEVAPRGVLGAGSCTSLRPNRLTDGSAAEAQAVRPGRCQGRTVALLCALLGAWRMGPSRETGE